MKIGILTFHASHNYGSMLQAWALQKYLNAHGHDAETINLRIKAQQDMYNFPLRPVKGKYRAFIAYMLNPIGLYHACKKWMRYEKFLSENLRLTERTYKSWEEIVSDIPSLGYQCLITGGDQIWNMNCKDHDKAYFLPCKLSGVKKISYAPSCGNLLLKITEEQKAFMKESLADYSHISVRETSMQSFLSELTDSNVDVTVDPTLLLNSSQYEELISEEPIVKGKYIFYYSPFRKVYAEKLAMKIGRQLGMPVVTAFPRLYRNNGMDVVPEAGPAEFLNLLRNASLVIGKSFHLVVFSLIFHKEFIAVDGDTDARMKNILTKLQIPERGQVNEDNYKTVNLPSIDFEKVDALLRAEREFSEKYLEKSLNE